MGTSRLGQTMQRRVSMRIVVDVSFFPLLRNGPSGWRPGEWHRVPAVLGEVAPSLRLFAGCVVLLTSACRSSLMFPVGLLVTLRRRPDCAGCGRGLQEVSSATGRVDR